MLQRVPGRVAQQGPPSGVARAGTLAPSRGRGILVGSPGPRVLARLPVRSSRKLRQTLCPFILVLVVRCGGALVTPGRSAGDGGGGGGGEPMEKVETRGIGGLTLEELEARSRAELLPDRLEMQMRRRRCYWRRGRGPWFLYYPHAPPPPRPHFFRGGP